MKITHLFVNSSLVTLSLVFPLLFQLFYLLRSLLLLSFRNVSILLLGGLLKSVERY